MANGKEVHNGVIACPAYLPLGTEIEILSGQFINNQFICEDRMGLKYRNSKNLDVWIKDCDIAWSFGRQHLEIIIK